MKLSYKHLDSISESLTKTAFVAPLLRGAYGLGKGVIGNVVKGAFSSTKGKPIGNKIFTWGSRIGLGAGAYGAGKYVYNKMPGVPAQPNYTTSMRNNVLAGKISPEEMDPQDLADVRSLGMKKMSVLGAAFTALGAAFYAQDALKAVKETMGKAKIGLRPPQPKFNVEGGMKA